MKTIACMLLALLLISCDWIVSVEGVIIDDGTGEPISGATVTLFKDGDIQKSDTAGYFKVFKRGGGKIPAPSVCVIKDGYKPFRIQTSYSRDGRSYLVKSVQENYQYKEPYYPDPENRKTFIVSRSVEKYSQNFAVRNDTLIIFLSKNIELQPAR